MRVTTISVMDEQNYCSDAENTNSALEDDENAPADIIPAKWWLESFENKKLPRDAIAMYRLLLTCPGFHVDTVQAYLQNFEKLRNTCLAAMTVLRQSLSAPSDQRRATKLVTHLRVIASGEHALLESKLLHEHMLRKLVREGSGEFGHGFDGFSKLEASRLGAARLFVDDYVEGRDPKKRRIESDPDHNPFAPPLSPAKNTTPSPPPKGIPTLFTPEVIRPSTLPVNMEENVPVSAACKLLRMALSTRPSKGIYYCGLSNPHQPTLLDDVNVSEAMASIQNFLLQKKDETTLKDTHEYLALHSCLLLTDVQPRLYQTFISEKDWATLLRHFVSRALEQPTLDEVGMAQSLILETLTSKSGIPASLAVESDDDMGTATVKNILQQLCPYLQAAEPKKVGEPTWMIRYVAPLFASLLSEKTDVTFDNTTSYGATRPDVFVMDRETQRSILTTEIKSRFAGMVEKKKDLARVLVRCIEGVAKDAFKWENKSAPVKMALHLPGDLGTVYEVFLFNRVYVAVDVGSLRVTTVLTQRNSLMMAEAICGAFRVQERIRRNQKNMAYDTLCKNRSRAAQSIPPTLAATRK
ncbi:hypothetical protein DFS34DRAFT_681873 [Phlyctochytrium arcticum]|nr:hypothetical protein DFS34DRAFT_681873 [Phlyctochytrium arcticum]